ncbi:MAG: hypothetical protein ABIO94_11495 [Opitutaceae bacterium]
MAVTTARSGKFALLWLGSLALCGCTPISYIVLKNNSGGALTVVSDSESHTAAIAEVIRFVSPGSTHQLVISTPAGERLTYNTSYPGKAYIYKHHMFVVVESNRRIYLLESKLGLTSLPAQQPSGFPWAPASSR